MSKNHQPEICQFFLKTLQFFEAFFWEITATNLMVLWSEFFWKEEQEPMVV
jgi:hypothetical protein